MNMLIAAFWLQRRIIIMMMMLNKFYGFLLFSTLLMTNEISLIFLLCWKESPNSAKLFISISALKFTVWCGGLQEEKFLHKLIKYSTYFPASPWLNFHHQNVSELFSFLFLFVCRVINNSLKHNRVMYTQSLLHACHWNVKDYNRLLIIDMWKMYWRRKRKSLTTSSLDHNPHSRM